MATRAELEWRADCLKSRMDSMARADAEDPCWKGYEQRGTKEQGGRSVPNCVEADGTKVGEDMADIRRLLSAPDRKTAVEELRAAINDANRAEKSTTSTEYRRAKTLYSQSGNYVVEAGGRVISTASELREAARDLRRAN